MSDMPVQETSAPQVPNDVERNFAMLRKKLEQEQQARLQAEAKAAELEKQFSSRFTQTEEEDDDGEPYVDKRKLSKEISRFAEKSKQETRSEIQQAVQQAIAEERRQNWLKQNSDFQEVMQHAQKFADLDPELAETILAMPDTFERQKLVYKNIKALGLHKPKEEKSSIQDTIAQRQRTPYYQPSGIASAPYGHVIAGNVSREQGESAYQKMKELQARMRLG